MDYRLLKRDEWPKLQELMDPQYIPSPDSAAAAVAEDGDGRICGVLFMQLVLHMEPLVLSSPSVKFDRLYDVLYDEVHEHKGLRFYAFADRDVVARMAEHVGLKRTPYAVFEGEVT